ncbi:hypothetical protein ILYODFUR_029918 [Ilyodon furcidens]|uniref:Uncharacterized protein n=1 Tax=Ilyodon furcidens TaxID=33524 RepID=A0ABV0TMV4_9TELE
MLRSGPGNRVRCHLSCEEGNLRGQTEQIICSGNIFILYLNSQTIGAQRLGYHAMEARLILEKKHMGFHSFSSLAKRMRSSTS